MLTQRVLRLGEWLASRDIPPDLRPASGPSGRFFEDVQDDTVGLAFTWIALCIAFFLLAIIVATLYSAVAGTPPPALMTLLEAPPVFTAVGVFLQGLRALAATFIIRLIGRGNELEPNPAVDCLLAPRDTDLFIQLVLAVLFVAANL